MNVIVLVKRKSDQQTVKNKRNTVYRINYLLVVVQKPHFVV